MPYECQWDEPIFGINDEIKVKAFDVEGFKIKDEIKITLFKIG